MTAKVLVTGFAPFDGRGVNRSWSAVLGVPDYPWLERRQLPVDFAALAGLVPALVAAGHHALVMVGEAAEAPAGQLAVERIALNVAHARGADNAGARPQLAPLLPGLPLALEARWALGANAAADALAGDGSDGVSARVSHHAGTFCCNAALFHALGAADAAPASAPRTIGFVHVPVAAPPDDAALGRALERLLLTFR